jgi:hypothetical protein
VPIIRYRKESVLFARIGIGTLSIADSVPISSMLEMNIIQKKNEANTCI